MNSILRHNVSALASRVRFAYRHSVRSGRGGYIAAYRMAVEVYPLKHVTKSK